MRMVLLLGGASTMTFREPEIEQMKLQNAEELVRLIVE